jgi:hypothetical protein
VGSGVAIPLGSFAKTSGRITADRPLRNRVEISARFPYPLWGLVPDRPFREVRAVCVNRLK